MAGKQTVGVGSPWSGEFPERKTRLFSGAHVSVFSGVFKAFGPRSSRRRWCRYKGGRSVGESLRQIHRRMPDKELTPQIEQEIVEAVQAVQACRAERRG